MANIPYVGELGLKRALKGVVDWIKEKYVQGSIITDGGGYPRAVKFDITPAAGVESGYIKIGENDDNDLFIESYSGGPGTIYHYNLAKEDALTKWTYATATQTAPKNFTLSGPTFNSSTPTIAFIENTNEFRILCNYGTGNNAITIDKTLATTNLVNNLDQWNLKWDFTDNSNGSTNNEVWINTEYTGRDDKAYNFRMQYYPAYHYLYYGIYSQELDNDIVNGYIPDMTKVQEMITEGLGSISGVQFQVVSTLPATGVNGVFYLIANPTASGSNIYDEYVWVNKGTTESPNYAFERLGTMDVDLTGYIQETDLVPLTNDEIDGILVEIGVKQAAPTPAP